MADSSTTSYEFTLPEQGGSKDNWGTKLNTNFTLIDTLLASGFSAPATPDETLGRLKEGALPVTATVSGAWSFVSLATTLILSGTTDSRLALSGGDGATQGGGLKLWAQTHPFTANDFALSSADKDIIRFDYSADTLTVNNLAGATQLTMSANTATMGNSASDPYTIQRSGSGMQLNLCGGNGANDGGNLQLSGSASASGGDFSLRSGTTDIVQYDVSASTLNLFSSSRVNIGAAYSPTGANSGMSRISDENRTSRTGTSTANHYSFYNGNGLVGRIRSNGSSVDYLTSSDERLKQSFTTFDGLSMVNQMVMYEFTWLSDGQKGYGPKAQELANVMPGIVARGTERAAEVGGRSAGRNPLEEIDEPWAYDPSKLVPILIKAVQELSAKVDALEAGS